MIQTHGVANELRGLLDSVSDQEAVDAMGRFRTLLAAYTRLREKHPDRKTFLAWELFNEAGIKP